LPYAATHDRALMPVHAPVSPAAHWQSLSLLLVEDDRADAVLVEDLIADVVADIRVIWAQSVAHAEREPASARPDCVLLDLHLPDASGMDALDRIPKRDATVPIVVLTGLNDEYFGASAVAAGAQDYQRSARMTSAGRPIDILLVEDDPGDELVTREAFEHNKIKNRLHVAHDGEEGLDYLYRRGPFQDAPRPDLILLDLNLPKYDGRQLLEKVKSEPDLPRIPVVVLTTSSAEEDILRSYELRANAYITKPVDADQFISAVRQIDEFFLQVVRLPQA